MGCDIHSMLEVTDHAGAWTASKIQIFKNRWFDPEGVISFWNDPYSDTPLRHRDYDLFAMLADVRNSGNITPLHSTDEHRGVPDDASKRWRKYAGDDLDIHSTTWFTLAELAEAFERGHFKQATEQSGVLDVLTYAELRVNGVEPTHWSGGVGGGLIAVGTEHDLYEILQPFITRQQDIERELQDIPPMPGEQRGSSPPSGLDTLISRSGTHPAIGGYTHVTATWDRVIDREPVIREMLEIATRFAKFQGDLPDGWDIWERDENGRGIKRRPDPRPRDLTTVRLMIGFDN